MKRRLTVRADSELQMRQGSLVELTERINDTYRIALTCVSLLIPTLIEDAVSFLFFKGAFHLLIFFSPEHDLYYGVFRNEIHMHGPAERSSVTNLCFWRQSD